MVVAAGAPKADPPPASAGIWKAEELVVVVVVALGAPKDGVAAPAPNMGAEAGDAPKVGVALPKLGAPAEAGAPKALALAAPKDGAAPPNDGVEAEEKRERERERREREENGM